VYLIAGLGNPGLEYEMTRHNAGFMVIDLWRRTLGVRLSDRRFQSRSRQVRFGDKEVILLCPTTFMNQSGRSIKACVDFYSIKIEDILVVQDDIDLTLGRIKVARGGGTGGHKGILSIVHHLRDSAFARIKIGVGRPRHGEAVEDYVLSPFYTDEIEVVEKVIRLGVQACEAFVSSGVESAMNVINCQNLTSKEVIG
jgi:PTH1 family peptidyl-tRNA hydrolase